jgi:hypothetical protein
MMREVDMVRGAQTRRIARVPPHREVTAPDDVRRLEEPSAVDPIEGLGLAALARADELGEQAVGELALGGTGHRYSLQMAQIIDTPGLWLTRSAPGWMNLPQ